MGQTGQKCRTFEKKTGFNITEKERILSVKDKAYELRRTHLRKVLFLSDNTYSSLKKLYCSPIRSD